jgi:chemotaxis protein MotB
LSHGDGDGGEGNSERWLVSYADFITLLMVLFVVLYSMSQVDLRRFQMLAESLHTAFAGGGEGRTIDTAIGQAGAGGDSAPDVVSLEDMPRRPLESLDVASRLSDMLRAQHLGGAVSVRKNVEGLLISMSEKIVFEPGTAVLLPEAYPVLDSIIEMVGPLDNDLRVVGHTAAQQPPADPRVTDNWRLSVLRATTIVDYLIAGGVAPARLMAAGVGDFHPLFPNDSPEHMALNSRADIIIVYPLEKAEVIDLGIDAMQNGSP